MVLQSSGVRDEVQVGGDPGVAIRVACTLHVHDDVTCHVSHVTCHADHLTCAAARGGAEADNPVLKPDIS